MKIVGIVCEYNPFHKGHEYQIEKAKELTGCETAVCVMSGNFMQRGDIAVFDKFTRAKSALLSGADLVIELPTVFSLSCAEKFAFGAVSILNAIGADYISFGAESSDIKELGNLANLLSDETKDFKKSISKKLKSGISYQVARDETLEELCGVDTSPLSKPNNALAIEYLKALKRLNSAIEPVLIKRKGAGYNSKILNKSKFASASGIREYVKQNGIKEDLADFVPSHTLDLFKEKKPVFLNELDNIILYKLRSMDKTELKIINDVTEGLENRIIDGAKKCTSTEELINFCSGKRYTKNRIARIILCALLGIKKADVTAPEYVRVLGMTKRGAKVLSDIKKTCPLPVINKLAAYKGDKSMLKFDLLASDIYSLFTENKQALSDFKTSPAVIDKDEENYVYIIRCADNSLYCGWTNDLKKRFSDHQNGKGAKYTKGRGPLELVYFEVIKDKNEALKREYEIKQLSRSKKDKLIKDFIIKLV